MKRFLIHVDTNWCGEEDTFRAVAESEIELWDIAEQLAYDNFYSFGHDQSCQITYLLKLIYGLSQLVRNSGN